MALPLFFLVLLLVVMLVLAVVAVVDVDVVALVVFRDLFLFFFIACDFSIFFLQGGLLFGTGSKSLSLSDIVWITRARQRSWSCCTRRRLSSLPVPSGGPLPAFSLV